MYTDKHINTSTIKNKYMLLFSMTSSYKNFGRSEMPKANERLCKGSEFGCTHQKLLPKCCRDLHNNLISRKH